MSAAKDPLGFFDDEAFDAQAAEYARLFIRHLDIERNLSPHTVRAYAGDLRDYLSWAARADTDPLHLDHRRFRRYMAQLDRAGYARKTTCRRLAAVRSFFSYLNERGLLDENPAAVAATPKVSRELPRVTSQADIEKLMASCDSSTAVGMRDRAFLELLYACGARIAELAALKPSDIDFTAGEVRLFGKGGKERIVPLHALALSCARAYLDAARAQLMVKGPVPEMFVSTRGNPMTAAALRRVFHERAAMLDRQARRWRRRRFPASARHTPRLCHRPCRRRRRSAQRAGHARACQPVHHADLREPLACAHEGDLRAHAPPRLNSFRRFFRLDVSVWAHIAMQPSFRMGSSVEKCDSPLRQRSDGADSTLKVCRCFAVALSGVATASRRGRGWVWSRKRVYGQARLNT